MKQSSGSLFLKFGLSFCGIVFVMIALNTLVRGTEGKPVNPWETSQETGAAQDEGLSIMKHYGCFLCHRIDDFGGNVGPKLNGVKSRKTREQLFAWIKSPSSIKPGTIMPEFHLSNDEILKIISYLET